MLESSQTNCDEEQYSEHSIFKNDPVALQYSFTMMMWKLPTHLVPVPFYINSVSVFLPVLNFCCHFLVGMRAEVFKYDIKHEMRQDSDN